MKLFPVHPILWSILLVWCASQSDIDIDPLQTETEANDNDVCQDEKDPGNIYPLSPPEQGHYVEEVEVKEENFRCLLYPTNLLNCSWSFHTLQKDAHLFVHISICHGYRAVPSPNLSSEEKVGSFSFTLHKHEMLYVILNFNISMHGEWTVYTSTYDMAILEVLSPPHNISASVKDGGLLVTWDLPHHQTEINPSCFEYQLDLGDQEEPKTLPSELSYIEANADPTRSYSVRMRVRKMDICQAFSHWSDWSHAITVEQSIYKLNTLVIISISLGIPMILLAVLLLVRHQRVSKILFPPIPRPPPKYKCFLEKNDTTNFFHPAPSAEPMEEITEVEDMEQKPIKTLEK